MAGSYWVNQTTTFQMSQRDQLIWLAGLLDGEGCIAFARRSDYDPHRLLQLRYDVKIAMTCEMTIRYAYQIMVDTIGEGAVLEPFEEKRRSKRVLPLWRTEVGSKRGVHDLLLALEPFLVTKKLEAQLTLRYLERALQSRHYRPTPFDRQLAELATALRGKGRGEARPEAQELLRQVIPSQASSGHRVSGVLDEGVETSGLSPNNNDRHECPAPSSLHATGEEIVQSASKDASDGINSRRLN